MKNLLMFLAPLIGIILLSYHAFGGNQTLFVVAVYALGYLVAYCREE